MLGITLTPLKYVALAIAVSAAVTTVGALMYSYDARGRKVIELQRALNTSLGAHQACQSQLSLGKETISVLNDRLTERSGSLTDLCAIYVRAKESAAPDANDCIDPTIGAVLEGLKKLDEKGKK